MPDGQASKGLTDALETAWSMYCRDLVLVLVLVLVCQNGLLLVEG